MKNAIWEHIKEEESQEIGKCLEKRWEHMVDLRVWKNGELQVHEERGTEWKEACLKGVDFEKASVSS